jgi:hypothetical protein
MPSDRDDPAMLWDMLEAARRIWEFIAQLAPLIPPAPPEAEA